MAITTLNNLSINRSDTAAADNVWTATSATATDFQAAAAGGKLLQVVIGYKLESESQSGIADTWTDLANMTVTTGALASTSSRVLVMANVHVVGDEHIGIKIVDGAGSDITNFIGDTTGSRTRATAGSAYRANNDMAYVFNGMAIDSPASTDAQTYKIQWRCATTAIVFFNRIGSNDANDANNFSFMSSITAMEIAG